MVQGGGFEPGMNQKPTGSAIQNEAGNGLKNDHYTLAMARTSAPHSATAQFFINAADNEFLNFKSETRAGLGLRRLRPSDRPGQDVVDRIEGGAHRQPRRPRRRAARRRDDHARDGRLLTTGDGQVDGSAVAGVPALGGAAAPPTFEAPARLARDRSASPTCTSPRTRREVFEAWAAHLRNTDADAVFILGDLFEVWIGDDMAERGVRGALRRGAALRRRRGGWWASWPATATSSSATRCSSRAA